MPYKRKRKSGNKLFKMNLSKKLVKDSGRIGKKVTRDLKVGKKVDRLGKTRSRSRRKSKLFRY
jgi:hypothetical protein